MTHRRPLPAPRPAPSGARPWYRVLLRTAFPFLASASLALGACSGPPSEDGGGPGFLSGEPLEIPVAKPAFTLTDVSDGAPYAFREETEGYVTLLFIGYTHCPDVCPVHMANLAAVLEDLPYEVAERVRVVFVSSDPERDTPERIRSWLDSFDPSFVGLRGSREEVQRIEEKLGLPPSVVDAGSGGSGDLDGSGTGASGGEEGGDPDDYFVGHAAQVIAFAADDTARIVYPWGTRQRDWRRDLPLLVRGEGTASPTPPGA